MAVTAVIGVQWGDEGKGKVVDRECELNDYQVVARYNGGPNAGHTIVIGQWVLALHQIPSGIRNPNTMNIIGSGTLVDLVRLAEEENTIQTGGLYLTPKNFAMDYAAHLILPHHVALDELRESVGQAQGSTKRGIAYAAADKYRRDGVRAEILDDPDQLIAHAHTELRAANMQRRAAGLEPYDVALQMKQLRLAAKRFAPFVADTAEAINDRLDHGQNVLAEGAQAAWLDIDHGAYPYNSSSHVGPGGIANGLGVAPQHITEIIAVAKAIKSRVGLGPFVTEFDDEEEASRIRGPLGAVDSEFGASTRRPRRLGYFDEPEIDRFKMLYRFNKLVINKLDWLPRLGATILVCNAYEIDGKTVFRAPGSIAQLARAKPLYEKFPSWTQDISGYEQYDELPIEAQQITDHLSRRFDVPVVAVGVGPRADQLLTTGR